MSKKLEKLREINKSLNTLLSKLETRVFIENIYDINQNKSQEEQQIFLAELK